MSIKMLRHYFQLKIYCCVQQLLNCCNLLDCNNFYIVYFSQNLPKGRLLVLLFQDWLNFCKTNNSSNNVMQNRIYKLAKKNRYNKKFYYNVGTCCAELEQHVKEDVLTSRLLSWINEIQFVLNIGRILCILCGTYLKVQKI